MTIHLLVIRSSDVNLLIKGTTTTINKDPIFQPTVQ